MNEHTVKAFDEDITRLRGLIAEMGGLAEVAIQEALDALVKGDHDLAKKVIKGLAGTVRFQTTVRELHAL